MIRQNIWKYSKQRQTVKVKEDNKINYEIVKMKLRKRENKTCLRQVSVTAGHPSQEVGKGLHLSGAIFTCLERSPPVCSQLQLSGAISTCLE